jgi:O-antigen/teichoic acid export membrane protein
VGATWINAQVDKYALLYFYDAKIVGEFAVVTKVVVIVTMAVMVFRQAWLPYSFSLARRADHGEAQFKKVLTAYYCLGLTCCLVVVYFSEVVFSFLAPGEYQIEVGILPVLLLASLVYGSASIVNVGMMVSGKTEWNSYASFIGVTLNILLTIILVPLFGIAGAAWGTLVASLVFMLVLSWRSNKLLAISFPLLRVMALSGVYFFCAFAVL